MAGKNGKNWKSSKKTGNVGKKKNYKRNYKKKHGFDRSELSNLYTAFSRNKWCIIPFTEKIRLGSSNNVDVTTGVTTQNAFGYEALYVLNSIHTPRISPTAGTNATRYRVLGYDDIASNWAKYKVYGVTLIITAQNPSTSGLAFGVSLQTPQNSQTLAGNLYGQSDARAGTYVNFVPSTGKRSYTFKRFIPLYKLVGVNKNQFNSDISNYSSPIDDSPANDYRPYLRLAVLNMNGTLNTTIDMDVQILYHCQLYDKVKSSQPTIA